MNTPSESQSFVLRRIRLLNFHNFVDETISIPEGGHLFLLGDNGSGKTTVLDAVHYVLTAGNRMEFNSAARLAGARSEGRRAQGIVLRYNVETGPLNKDGGISYAALEFRGREGRPLALAVGLSAFGMDEKIQRWGVIKESALEELPFVEDTPEGRRLLGQRELKEKLEGSGFYPIGAYEKELARRLYGDEETFREICEFLAMGKAYREIAAGAADYHELFKRLLPQPKTDLFERVIESLKSLDEAGGLLEDMERKFAYLDGLLYAVSQIQDVRETMARYRWLVHHLELQALDNLGREHDTRRRSLREQSLAAEAEAESQRARSRELLHHLEDMRARDAEGLVRQEGEFTDRVKGLLARRDAQAAQVEKERTALGQALENARRVRRSAAGLAGRLDGAPWPGFAGPEGREELQEYARTLLAWSGKAGGAEARDADRGRARPGEESSRPGNAADGEEGSGPPNAGDSTWENGDFPAVPAGPYPLPGLMDRVQALLPEQHREETRLEQALSDGEREAEDMRGELERLEAERELVPPLEGFAQARAALRRAGIEARPLYELLEWHPEAAPDIQDMAEEAAGPEVLSALLVPERDLERAQDVLMNFPGVRLCLPPDHDAAPPAWMRLLFDVTRSHPPALIALTEEMRADRAPSLERLARHEGAPWLTYRAHGRRLWANRAQWVGFEKRRLALEERLTALRAALQEKQAVLQRLRSALTRARENLRQGEDFLAAAQGLQRSLDRLEAEWRLAGQQVEHRVQGLKVQETLLREVRAEHQLAARRLEDLRDRIRSAGLERLEEKINSLEAERESAEQAFSRALENKGALNRELAELEEREAARSEREHAARSGLEQAAAAILEINGPLDDVAHYVLKTQKGQQFKSREHVQAALAEAGRREAEIQGGLKAGLHDPQFGSVFGFTYDAAGNALADRRGRPVAGLVAEQRRAIDEQREVVNEKTEELFKRIIVNELVAFFARHVHRLEEMVRRINRLLADRFFGNTRYRLELHREESFRPFLEAILRHNPMDGSGEEELRQFIEDNRDAIINAEVGEVPEVLDYRNWYRYRLRLFTETDEGIVMDRRTKSVGSGGEQAVPNYLLVLTMAHFLYLGNRSRLRLLLFDEAFYGIDAGRRDQLLGFAGDLGLQLLVASPDQDGVKREIRSSTTLLVVKDRNYDVHLYPFHWENPAEKQLDILAPVAERPAFRFEEELGGSEGEIRPG